MERIAQFGKLTRFLSRLNVLSKSDSYGFDKSSDGRQVHQKGMQVTNPSLRRLSPNETLLRAVGCR